ncbi:hypothetical protein T11_3699 [Trichinella zimbabwensis]|uniref:Uncharacterized protein n=1 Tax=Trichinella zimbabwensis TaxID=268475 RepID=A0A0V1DKP1_9BILA|nr:hypothetical protein T11_3699 [Trichinella zimbabwensis]
MVLLTFSSCGIEFVFIYANSYSGTYIGVMHNLDF